MLNLNTVDARIRREISELEEAQNVAIAKAAALMHTVALARNLPEVQATIGQPIMLAMASLTGHLAQGGSDIARVHAHLVTIGRELGVMVPDDIGECPFITGLAEVSEAA